MTVLHRRIAPALLLGQVAYAALLEFAFTFLAPRTGELDHTESDPSGLLLYGLLVAAAVVGMTGGAVLLGSAKARAATPHAVRAGWLGLLSLGEAAIAIAFAGTALAGGSGPDPLIGMAGTLVAGCVAYVCCAETGSAVRRASRQA
ncbi:hypothetical protein [Streptomyces sp. NPDC046909]|uniref:hypothetical protein n=1 Tax=Streptomyces sp. NPDC046909 TaxID=3155617 RepID=UPI0033C0F089